MHYEIRNALLKVGVLIVITGKRLKMLAKNDPSMKDLADIHETLTYCAEALSQIGDALVEETSRENHGL